MTYFTTTKPTWNDTVAGFGFVQSFAGQRHGYVQTDACALRAVTIATGLAYNDVWRRLRGGYRPGIGTCPDSTTRMLKRLGWAWVSLGKTPKPLDKIKIDWQGDYVFYLSQGHAVAVLAGEFHDTGDSRWRRIGKWVRQADGKRHYQERYYYVKVYGYWHHAN